MEMTLALSVIKGRSKSPVKMTHRISALAYLGLFYPTF